MTSEMITLNTVGVLRSVCRYGDSNCKLTGDIELRSWINSESFACARLRSCAL